MPGGPPYGQISATLDVTKPLLKSASKTAETRNVSESYKWPESLSTYRRRAANPSRSPVQGPPLQVLESGGLTILGFQSRNTQTLDPVRRPMDTAVKAALEQGGVIDITTVEARNGTPHRIEIAFLHFEGSYYITGYPGHKRDWLANMHANPEFTVHLKRGLSADVSAVAEEITDEDERAKILYRIMTERWGNEPAKAEHILPRWVKNAPLVRFSVN